MNFFCLSWIAARMEIDPRHTSDDKMNQILLLIQWLTDFCNLLRKSQIGGLSRFSKNVRPISFSFIGAFPFAVFYLFFLNHTLPNSLLGRDQRLTNQSVDSNFLLFVLVLYFLLVLLVSWTWRNLGDFTVRRRQRSYFTVAIGPKALRWLTC